MRYKYGDRLERAYSRMDSSRFDLIMKKMGLGPNSLSRRKFFEALGDLEGKDILELGVGSGYNIPYYKGMRSFTGVDLSAKLLEETQFKCFVEGLDNISDLSSEVPENKKFDLVVLTYVLSGTSDMAQTFSKALSHVKQGGTIAILDTYDFSTSIANRVLHIILRAELTGVGLRQSPHDVYYSQRKNFRIEKSERIVHFNIERGSFQKEYFLIGRKK